MISARTSQSSLELSQEGINRRNTMNGVGEKSYTHTDFISIQDPQTVKIPRKTRPQTSKPISAKKPVIMKETKREREVAKLFSIFGAKLKI